MECPKYACLRCGHDKRQIYLQDHAVGVVYSCKSCGLITTEAEGNEIHRLNGENERLRKQFLLANEGFNLIAGNPVTPTQEKGFTFTSDTCRSIAKSYLKEIAAALSGKEEHEG